MLPLVLSSDSHVFEPPELWQTRIDAAFRDRAPLIQRIDGADQIMPEAESDPLRDRPHLERWRVGAAGRSRKPHRSCFERGSSHAEWLTSTRVAGTFFVGV